MCECAWCGDTDKWAEIGIGLPVKENLEGPVVFSQRDCDTSHFPSRSPDNGVPLFRPSTSGPFPKSMVLVVWVHLNETTCHVYFPYPRFPRTAFNSCSRQQHSSRSNHPFTIKTTLKSNSPDCFCLCRTALLAFQMNLEQTIPSWFQLTIIQTNTIIRQQHTKDDTSNNRSNKTKFKLH